MTGNLPDCAQRLVLSECLDRWRHETKQGIVDTGRYRCRYVEWGRGPTLVLVPGMGLDALGFVMLMARLQTQFRCISYDLPDGDADGARLGAYQHRDLVADLFSLLDYLGIQSCHALGSSFGSTIVLAAMHRQPARFPRAIFQGGFARRRLTWAEVLAASFLRFAPGRLGHLPLVRRILEYNEGPALLAREPEVFKFFIDMHVKIPLRAFASRALMIHRLDLRPILAAITQPTLMICGDRDRIVNKGCEQELKAGLPTVARAEIEQCGHLPMLTHPEVLAEVVGQFLASPSCSAPSPQCGVP